MDPISEEELKRARRIKQYQDYQNHIDELAGKDKADSPGEINGKKVKKVESKEKGITLGLFKNIIQKKD